VTGVELIAAERQRQIEVEGYDAAHDDTHNKTELLAAAICYVTTCRPGGAEFYRHVPGAWPWDDASWRPKADFIGNLAKAGALIAAEMDRRLRELTSKPADVARDILADLDGRVDWIPSDKECEAMAWVVLAAHEYVNGSDPDSFAALVRALDGEA